jgi:hypothetical protein
MLAIDLANGYHWTMFMFVRLSWAIKGNLLTNIVERMLLSVCKVHPK